MRALLLLALSGCQLVGLCSSDSDCDPGWSCNASECQPNQSCFLGGIGVTLAPCPPGDHCARLDPDPLDGIGQCLPGPGCATSADCPFTGEYCAPWGCALSCTCGNDREARDAGYGWCDDRHTCEPGDNPHGACNAGATCATPPPACQPGAVPLVKDGCYTGDCTWIGQCEAPPACSALQHEADCTGRADCAVVSDGVDCTAPDGTACTSSSTSCTCQSFVFASCRAR